MIKYNEITGVILAGGKSSRMGKDKALIDIHGKPIIRHVIETMKQIFDRVIIIANDQRLYRLFGLEVFSDIYVDCGPLGGIHSAFFHTFSDKLFIIACDTPDVSPDLIRYVCDFHSSSIAKVPFAEGTLHPLIGMYHRDCLPILLSHLESNRLKMASFLDAIEAECIPISESLSFYKPGLFRNINCEADLSQQERLN
jgi:molybdenum cofactor guanylyltransferase